MSINCSVKFSAIHQWHLPVGQLASEAASQETLQALETWSHSLREEMTQRNQENWSDNAAFDAEGFERVNDPRRVQPQDMDWTYDKHSGQFILQVDDRRKHWLPFAVLHALEESQWFSRFRQAGLSIRKVVF